MSTTSVSGVAHAVVGQFATWVLLSVVWAIVMEH